MLRYLTVINPADKAEVIPYKPLAQDKLLEFYYERDSILYEGNKALEAHGVKERFNEKRRLSNLKISS